MGALHQTIGLGCGGEPEAYQHQAQADMHDPSHHFNLRVCSGRFKVKRGRLKRVQQMDGLISTDGFGVLGIQT